MEQMSLKWEIVIVGSDQRQRMRSLPMRPSPFTQIFVDIIWRFRTGGGGRRENGGVSRVLWENDGE